MAYWVLKLGLDLKHATMYAKDPKRWMAEATWEQNLADDSDALANQLVLPDADESAILRETNVSGESGSFTPPINLENGDLSLFSYEPEDCEGAPGVDLAEQTPCRQADPPGDAACASCDERAAQAARELTPLENLAAHAEHARRIPSKAVSPTTGTSVLWCLVDSSYMQTSRLSLLAAPPSLPCYPCHSESSCHRRVEPDMQDVELLSKDQVCPMHRICCAGAHPF